MTTQVPDPFGLVGQLLDGQYRVDAVIGEGGYGVVYKGWHLTFEQPIAIKALKVPGADEGPIQAAVLEKFRDEAKLLYTLSQASLSIVRSIGFGAVNTPSGAWAPFIVLEWLEGRALSADLAERRALRLRGRPLDEALALLSSAAQALAIAHQRRVAHRDVKPANFFLTRAADDPTKATMKVLDFGIAKVMTDDTLAGGQGTQSVFSSFTWLYAAPEQLDRRHGTTGPWSDVYSFALVLTEVLTDRAPIEASNAVEVLAIAQNRVVRPTARTRGADVPDAVEAILTRALAVEPKERYASLGEFWSALERAAEGLATTRLAKASMRTQPIAAVHIAPAVPPASQHSGISAVSSSSSLPALSSSGAMRAPAISPSAASAIAPHPSAPVAAAPPIPRAPSSPSYDPNLYAPPPGGPMQVAQVPQAPAPMYGPPYQAPQAPPPYGPVYAPMQTQPQPRSDQGCAKAMIVTAIVLLVIFGAAIVSCGAVAKSCGF